MLGALQSVYIMYFGVYLECIYLKCTYFIIIGMSIFKVNRFPVTKWYFIIVEWIQIRHLYARNKRVFKI